MKIIVAVKQVPQRDAIVRIDSNERWFDEGSLDVEINEADAYALEAALLLKEKHGGEVVVLCAGPERAGQAIREALAKGADRGLFIECEDLPELDTLAVAQRLVSAVKPEQPDLILTGLQSDDLGLGQTGVVMAELLGIPHATIIMQAEVQDGTIRVKRELENGWFQWVALPMPALLTVQSGISKLRYATLMGIKKAKSKEIMRIQPEPSGRNPVAVLDRVYLPLKSKETTIIPGAPSEAAATLVEKLRFEVRVL
jgi:electron transfer flavoprotein beta subunit